MVYACVSANFDVVYFFNGDSRGSMLESVGVTGLMMGFPVGNV